MKGLDSFRWILHCRVIPNAEHTALLLNDPNGQVT